MCHKIKHKTYKEEEQVMAKIIIMSGESLRDMLGTYLPEMGSKFDKFLDARFETLQERDDFRRCVLQNAIDSQPAIKKLYKNFAEGKDIDEAEKRLGVAKLYNEINVIGASIEFMDMSDIMKKYHDIFSGKEKEADKDEEISDIVDSVERLKALLTLFG